MEKLKESLAAKITATILLVVFLLVLFLSTLGVGYLVIHKGYEDGSDYVTESALKDMLYRDAQSLIQDIDYTCIDDANAAAGALSYLADLYPADDSNLWFRISTISGDYLVSNGDKPACRVERCDTYSNAWSTEYTYNSWYCDTLDEVRSYQSIYEQYGSDDGDYFYLNYWYDEEVEAYYVERIRHEEHTLQLEIESGVRNDLSARDDYRTVAFWMSQLYQIRYLLIVLCALSLVLALTLSVYLLWSAGHKAGVAGIYLHWANRIPFDLFAAFLVILAFIPFGIRDTYYSTSFRNILLGVSFFCCAILMVWLIVSFAARAKAGAWWKNTVIYRLLRLVKRGARWFKQGICYLGAKLPVLWKALLIWIGICVVEFAILLFARNNGLILWLVQFILVTPVMILVVLNLQTLQQGAKQIADGNLHYNLDLNRMLPDFRRHGEALNSISEGMQKAIEKQMSSERLKAELITNVSHDIKTPLTSIVNYVDLLKKPGNTPEQVREYLGVLDRQSARLKKLTEDLIEASKASTGNIAVNLERLDANMLLTQAGGEHSEKLAARHLELICNLCPETATILADGKLLWRVFDNLLDNIRKYAMEGTRVYLTSQLVDGKVIITFRNISRDPLNITSDELMERFVRGDASRNTEGSGLGLSIARSLTQLQKGDFDLSIDGDLFKAIITFDAINA